VTTTIAAVLAVHDRADLTVACLQALQRQRGAAGSVHVRAYVFDDGSTDGTAARIAGVHDDLVLLHGDGTFWWNGGMRVAIARALHDDPDHVLWLNDDTTLADDALVRLLEVQAGLGGPDVPAVVCGSVLDPDDGTLSYGGVVRDPVRRLRFEPVEPQAVPVRVDTMNGNVVLVPRAALRLAGNLSADYRHSMGDFDYGLRVVEAGGAVWLAPGTFGTCRANPGFTSGADGVTAELARFAGLRHLPPTDWGRFARRWGGPAWPLLWASPYARLAADAARRRYSAR
jgi:GT2 family glycosyltransferase